MSSLPAGRVNIIIRYFYPSDENRWINLEARGRIGVNQLALLNQYRKIKAATPTMAGMTATTINGKKTYAPILSR